MLNKRIIQLYYITYAYIVDMRMLSPRFGFIYLFIWTQRKHKLFHFFFHFSSTDAVIMNAYVCAETEHMRMNTMDKRRTEPATVHLSSC